MSTHKRITCRYTVRHDDGTLAGYVYGSNIDNAYDQAAQRWRCYEGLAVAGPATVAQGETAILAALVVA